MDERHPGIRVILAKLGLDGHDRGIRVVARTLRDAGIEVIYTGLWQTGPQVARAAAEEDAHAVGISVLSGAHMTLIPKLLEAMRAERVGHVPVVVGGIIPQQDIDGLIGTGVASVLLPGDSMQRVVECFRRVTSRGTSGDATR